MGIWMRPSGGIMYYSNERVSKQPSLFKKIYSNDVWSIGGPVEDCGWDDIDLDQNFTDEVMYTEQETQLFNEYV